MLTVVNVSFSDPTDLSLSKEKNLNSRYVTVPLSWNVMFTFCLFSLMKNEESIVKVYNGGVII